MRMTRAIVPVLALLAGCPGDGPGRNFPWEPGCITVDGEGGWAFLSDALTQAVDGSTVRLCGALRDTVVIDKELTFIGQGATTTRWRAPENEPAMRVVAGGRVTVRDVAISTTRNGFTVEEGGSLELRRVVIEVDQPGSYGIEIEGGDVVAENIVIADAFWGGIQNTGGTLSLSRSDIVNSLRWGVRLEDGATATIEDTLIGGTFISDETGANNDGWALYVCDDCEATLTGVDLESNVLGGAYVEGGTMTATGGRWVGNFIGGWFNAGSVVLDGVEVVDPFLYGIVSQAANVTLNEVVMDADPATSPFEDPSTSTLDGGYGLVAFDGEIAWTGGSIREFNGGGIYASGNAAAQLPLTLTRLTVQDNAAIGIDVALTDLTATDVKVEDTLNVDEICLPDGFTYYCNWGVGAFQSDVDWVGGSIRGNGAIGLLTLDGPTDLTRVEIADNQTFGLWAISGVLNLTEVDLSGEGLVGVEAQDGSVVSVVDSVFHDRTYVDRFDFDTTSYRFFYGATDLSISSSSLSVSGSSFRRGEAGITASSSDVTVTNSAFEDYLRVGVRVSGGTGLVDRSSFKDFGGDVLVCQGNASLVAQRSTISGVSSVPNRTEVWIEGELDQVLESSSFLPAIRADSCQLELSRIDVSDVEHQALRATNARLGEVDAVRLSRVATGLTGAAPIASFEASWSGSTPPELQLTELELTEARRGAAISLASSSTAAGEIAIEGLRLGDAAGLGGTGLAITGLTDVQITGVEITGAAGDGLVATRSTGTLTGVDPDGDYAGAIDAVGSALRLDDAPLAVTDLGLGASGAALLASGRAPTLTRVDAESTSDFGLVCVETEPVCEQVSASGALGAADGCGTCVAP